MSREERFYNSLLVKHGFELITVKNYRGTVKRFVNKMGTNKPKKNKAEEYLAEMRKKDYSYSHIANTGVIVCKYMEFIGRTIEWRRPRRPNTLPTREILTEGEVARILAITNNSREKSLVSILAYCGLRNKEVCGLQVKDLDLDNNLIKVIGGKFNKDRIVPMSRECAKTLIKYIRDYEREKKKRLFRTLARGNNYNGWALRKLTKVLARRARVNKRVYPHLFRHSFISHLIDRGANLVAVQQFAGHAKIETTMLYTHLTPQRIRKEYEFHIPTYI